MVHRRVGPYVKIFQPSVYQSAIADICAGVPLPSDILGLKCEKIISLKHYSPKFKVTLL